MADLQLCGKWMPRAQTTCVRTPLHGGSCATAEAMSRKLKRYGMTKDSFARILAAQKNACAMCFAPVEEGQLVGIDHDHK